MQTPSRTLIATTARLLKAALGLLLTLTVFPFSAAAQNTTVQNAQTPQPPGGPQDTGAPIIIVEGQGVATDTGRQTQVISTILDRNPTDPEHAMDPNTGRNFNWDSATNSWVNSQTGERAGFLGYLRSTSGPSIPSATSTSGAAPSVAPRENKTVSTSGFTPTIQLHGFGGATFVSGNTPATAGFDGAVLFPLGNHILAGPTAGFQWVNSSIVQTVGSQQPGSTFLNTSVGFKQGNFGGSIVFPFGGFQLGIHGGATVAGSSITQAEGFCGLGNATSPAGCTVTSTTNTHDTVVGPFVGGYISHSIFSHVGVFVGYDYFRPSEFKTSTSVIDLHYSDVVAGLTFSFGSRGSRVGTSKVGVTGNTAGQASPPAPPLNFSAKAPDFTGEYTVNGNRVYILYQFNQPLGILVDAFSGDTGVVGTGTCGGSSCSGEGVTNDSQGEPTKYKFTILLNNNVPSALTFNSQSVNYSGPLVRILPEVPYQPNAAYTTD